MPPSPAAPASAFSFPDFRRVTQARFLFTFAVQIQAVVMGWQMYEITRDPLYLGLIGLVEAIPALTLALVSGYIVDRSNPLRIYRRVVAASFVSAALLVAVSVSAIPDSAKVPWIYAAAFITGLARGFSQPALYSLVPQLIPRHILAVSSAWITSAFQIAAISGPALGGVLYAFEGSTLPYAIDASMLLLSLASLSAMAYRPSDAPRAPETQPIFERLTSGMRYVRGHQLLLSALALDMFAVLFGGATALLPIFSAEILHAGPIGVGLLRASPAFGALSMSAWLIRRPVGRHAGRILLAVVAGYGLAIIGFALSRELWVSAVFLAASGALDSVSMVIRTAIVQLSSPADMRGRISAVNSIFIGSSNEIGAFESGLAAKLLGTVPSVIFGGVMTLLTVLLTAWLAPRMREMDIHKLSESESARTS